MNFICPKCTGKLNISDTGTAVCANGHCYDRSRYGYYNLLMSNEGGVHGDNHKMVEARRKFLDGGGYLPLCNELARICAKHFPGGAFVDIGCGEGYYTERVIAAISESGKCVGPLGFDISKDAIRYAARRCRGVSFAVASAYRMPIATGSISMAMNVFSPLAAEETARILRTGGIFVMAIPGEEHLFGLKRALYDTPYKNQPQDTDIKGFKLIDKSHIRYPLLLDSAEKIASLFMMTPYAYRTPRESAERVLKMDSLFCEAEFIILVYEKI